MKTRLFAALAACSLLFSIPTRAQEDAPPHPGNPLEAVQRILDLTDSQAQQLAELRQTHRQDVQPLMMQIRELERRKGELLQLDNPTPEQVGELGRLLFEQRNLQKQAQAANQSRREAALALLTEAQKEKVAQIQQALRLAPQAGPLAAFGLIERPRPHRPFRLMRRLRHRLGVRGEPGFRL